MQSWLTDTVKAQIWNVKKNWLEWVTFSPELEFKHRIIKKQEKYTEIIHIHEENCVKHFKLTKKKGAEGFTLSSFKKVRITVFWTGFLINYRLT